MEEKSTILIVDDDRAARETLDALLTGKGYHLEFASNGLEALNKATKLQPDLVLLDVLMPGINGFEVCRRLRADLQLSEVPVIMITSLDDRESRLQGLEAGADDFLTKPFDSIELRARIRTITRLNRYRHIMEKRAHFERLFDELPDGVIIVDYEGNILNINKAMLALLGLDEHVGAHLIGEPVCTFFAPSYSSDCGTWLKNTMQPDQHTTKMEIDLEQNDEVIRVVEVTLRPIGWNNSPAIQLFVHDITTQKKREERIENAHNELTLAYDATLVALVKVLDVRHQETEGHTYRVTEMTVRLARALGIHGDELVHIRRGAMLHDIGKMSIPDSILFKPDVLTDEEWEIVMQHPQHAYDWLYPIAYLRPSLDIPHCHHEKWDGTGYPLGLKGEEIPLAARIFAVVDVWDSLRSERPYRPAWSEEKVREHMRPLAGTHFDPRVLETFLAMYSPFADMSW